MKKIIPFILLIFLTFGSAFAQRKKLDTIKYNDCYAKIEIDFEKPKKYFEEAKKYLNKELIVIYTDDQKRIFRIERGYIKNSIYQNKKSIWFESKAVNDSKMNTYSMAPLNNKNQYCYFAECFDTK